jgi:hypothetical protein
MATGERSSVPQGSPDTTPVELSSGSKEARALHGKFIALEERISTLIEFNKSLGPKIDSYSVIPAHIDNVRKQVDEVTRSAASDFNRLLGWGGAAVFVLLAALTAGYFRLEDKIDDSQMKVEAKIEAVTGKLDDRITTANTTMVKATTQLDDLLARIPAQSTPPRR